MTTLKMNRCEPLQTRAGVSSSAITLFATIGRFQRGTVLYRELIRIEPAYPSRRTAPERIVLLTSFAK